LLKSKAGIQFPAFFYFQTRNLVAKNLEKVKSPDTTPGFLTTTLKFLIEPLRPTENSLAGFTFSACHQLWLHLADDLFWGFEP